MSEWNVFNLSDENDVRRLLDDCSKKQLIDYIFEQRAKMQELEKDIAFYRCCAISGEIPDDAQRPSLWESKDG